MVQCFICRYKNSLSLSNHLYVIEYDYKDVEIGIKNRNKIIKRDFVRYINFSSSDLNSFVKPRIECINIYIPP